MDETEPDTVILAPEYRRARAEAASFAAELEASIQADTIELPSLPDVALRIRDALAREDADLDRLTELAGADPALAARLMKIANSALFSRGGQPTSNLHMAVVRLGARMVRNTAIAIAAQQVFIGYASEPIRTELERVWRHSIHVASLGHLLLSVRRSDIPPDDGFLAGLLHEIGTLFILLRAKDRPALWAEPQALRAVIDACQARIGAKIVTQWEFHDALIEAVGGHDRSPLEVEAPVTLCAITGVANHLAETTADCEDLEQFATELPAFGALRLDAEALGFALRVAREESDALLANLAAGPKPQAKAASNA